MISAPDLLALLPRPDAPAVLDLRTPEDAAADPTKLHAAQRLSLADLQAGAGPKGPVVTYCQKGGKISQLGASLLRARGADARALVGGHLAWQAAGLPVLPAAAPEGAVWVTFEAPDWAMLCRLWVLRRVLDPRAQVLAVAADQVAMAAEVIEGRVLDEVEAPAMTDGTPWLTLPGPDPALEALLKGRLARLGDPLAALDLVDDALAGALA